MVAVDLLWKKDRGHGMSVKVNNYGRSDAVEYLLTGHRDIGIITGDLRALVK